MIWVENKTQLQLATGSAQRSPPPCPPHHSEHVLGAPHSTAWGCAGWPARSSGRGDELLGGDERRWPRGGSNTLRASVSFAVETAALRPVGGDVRLGMGGLG